MISKEDLYFLIKVDSIKEGIEQSEISKLEDIISYTVGHVITTVYNVYTFKRK